MFSCQAVSTSLRPHELQHASLPFTISWSLLKLKSIALAMQSNHLIPCCPLLLLLSIFPSIRVFSNELALPIRWPENWSFSWAYGPLKEGMPLWGLSTTHPLLPETLCPAMKDRCGHGGQCRILLPSGLQRQRPSFTGAMELKLCLLRRSSRVSFSNHVIQKAQISLEC